MNLGVFAFWKGVDVFNYETIREHTLEKKRIWSTHAFWGQLKLGNHR